MTRFRPGARAIELVEYQTAYEKSWVYKELKAVRNAKPYLSKFGTTLGGAFGRVRHVVHRPDRHRRALDDEARQDRCRLDRTGRPSTSRSPIPSRTESCRSTSCRRVFISNTNHAEEQPAHLKLLDPSMPIRVNLPKYGEPARLYCPAGVYEVRLCGRGGEVRSALPSSTPRTASTAKPATSRIRPRTSSGRRPRAAAGRTIRICDARAGSRGLVVAA